MGGAQSTATGHGYHVLKVQENSPGRVAGLEPFFDYIVGINGAPLDNPESGKLFQEQLTSNIDKEVLLAVYSTKEQVLREVRMVPSRSWSTDPSDGLIGCSIRYCAYNATNEHVWHILDVAADSPAEMAGMVPYTDYIIGTPHATLRNESDLYELAEQYVGRPLRLYVYNSDFDICREVIIMPNHDWGGEGSMGCGVGYGYLHRIPKTQRFQKLQREMTQQVVWSEKSPSSPRVPPTSPAPPPQPPTIVETPADQTEAEIIDSGGGGGGANDIGNANDDHGNGQSGVSIVMPVTDVTIEQQSGEGHSN